MGRRFFGGIIFTLVVVILMFYVGLMLWKREVVGVSSDLRHTPHRTFSVRSLPLRLISYCTSSATNNSRQPTFNVINTSVYHAPGGVYTIVYGYPGMCVSMHTRSRMYTKHHTRSSLLALRTDGAHGKNGGGGLLSRLTALFQSTKIPAVTSSIASTLAEEASVLVVGTGSPQVQRMQRRRAGDSGNGGRRLSFE
eukprot:TRINITY_DN983_c0_g1_i1.p1 TRINITY_DN983_c0_g1~~TRINITY_DN983_c0_g1_i1.p1  ORF type:complete len:195 (+),score=26.31 TRINITY_DN983_c0_g1_i1:130-714(+)